MASCGQKDKPVQEHKKYGRDILIGCLCAAGCEILYGLSFIFTKSTVESASMLSLLGWRFLIAFAAMSLCALTGLIKIDLRGRNIRPLLVVALFCPVLYFIGETVGVFYTTASESGVFIACIPAASMAASSLILHKFPTRLQVSGMLIAFAGVLATVLSAGLKSSFSPAGYAFLCVAVLSYALFCVFSEKSSGFSGAEITYVMLACGAAVFAALAAAEACLKNNFDQLLLLPFQDGAFLSAILYQGIGCSIFAFFMANVAIAKIGVNRTASFTGVATLVSIVSGVLALHEDFTLWQATGSAVILSGVYIANMDAGAGQGGCKKG